MKRIVVLLFAFSIVCGAKSQEVQNMIYIYMSGGNVPANLISDIKDITFSEDQTLMQVNLASQVQSYSISEIDSIATGAKLTSINGSDLSSVSISILAGGGGDMEDASGSSSKAIKSTGGASSTPTTSFSTQHYWLKSNISLTSGSVYHLTTSTATSGTNILVFKAPRTLTSATVLLSSPSLVKGTTYYLMKGAAVAGTETFHDYYETCTATGGTTSGSTQAM